MFSLETIGYYGPMIVLLLTISVVWSRTNILLVFLIFYIANILVNRGLKVLLREPRPVGNTYGMPSRHAQDIVFASVFLYLVTRSPWSLLTIVLVGTTMYQRYESRRHTIRQIVVGACIGFIIAWIAFLLAGTLHA